MSKESNITPIGESSTVCEKDESANDVPLEEAPVESVPVPVASPKQVAKILGCNLRILQKKLFPGWGGQKKLAEFLGLSANDICAYQYARMAPSDARLEEIARKVGYTVEQLRTPLPGSSEEILRPRTIHSAAVQNAEEVNEMKRVIARLEGRLEELREELADQRAKIAVVREANYALRIMMHLGDNSPKTQAQREQIWASLSPAVAELVGKP